MVFESFNLPLHLELSLNVLRTDTLHESEASFSRENLLSYVGWDDAVYFSELERLLGCHLLIFIARLKTILSMLTETKNVDVPFFVCNETGHLEHLSHIEFATVPVAAVHLFSRLATTLRGIWVPPALEGFFDINTSHANKVNALNDWLGHSLVEETEDDMMIVSLEVI